MSPLTKEVIEKLSNEDGPDDIEKSICEQYQREEHELVDLNNLI